VVGKPWANPLPIPYSSAARPLSPPREAELEARAALLVLDRRRDRVDTRVHRAACLTAEAAAIAGVGVALLAADLVLVLGRPAPPRSPASRCSSPTSCSTWCMSSSAAAIAGAVLLAASSAAEAWPPPPIAEFETLAAAAARHVSSSLRECAIARTVWGSQPSATTSARRSRGRAKNQFGHREPGHSPCRSARYCRRDVTVLDPHPSDRVWFSYVTSSQAAGLRRRSSSKPLRLAARRFSANYAAPRTPRSHALGAALRFAFAAGANAESTHDLDRLGERLVFMNPGLAACIDNDRRRPDRSARPT